MAAFCETWKRRYGVSYEITGQDRGLLKSAVTEFSAEALAALPDCFERYMADEDPFVAQTHRHALWWFFRCGGVNKYRTRTPILSTKEAKGVAATRDWLEMHEERDARGKVR